MYPALARDAGGGGESLPPLLDALPFMDPPPLLEAPPFMDPPPFMDSPPLMDAGRGTGAPERPGGSGGLLSGFRVSGLSGFGFAFGI